MTIAEALKAQMLAEDSVSAWAGDPNLLLTAYEMSGCRVEHPRNRIAAVLTAARRSKLFKQDGYIRACDSTGTREVLHPVFRLA
jgi:hypothetical protein